MTAPAYSGGKAAVRALADAAARRQVEKIRELRIVMGTPEGRAFVRRLIDQADVWSEGFPGGDAPIDPLKSAFQAGARAVAMPIVRTLYRSPEMRSLLDLMEQERQVEKS